MSTALCKAFPGNLQQPLFNAVICLTNEQFRVRNIEALYCMFVTRSSVRLASTFEAHTRRRVASWILDIHIHCNYIYLEKIG